ncbi:MAG: nitroreductase family deazaflavin-dependent oxidoreductase [Acidimicrobiales bacterium]|nr:nitroreductase family deazaflavin-dependent oxidoreductase [Acidimicrobiales bacterium]
MGLANSVVGGVLRSPAHRLLSGSTALLTYEGRRTGRHIVLPTRYARHGDEVVILVGRPETKQWWRNFERSRDLDVLLAGERHAMAGQAVRGADEPDAAAPLLAAYLDRFPKAAKVLGDGTDDDRLTRAVLVRCRPR